MPSQEKWDRWAEKVLAELPVQILLAQCFSPARWYDRRHEKPIDRAEAKRQSDAALRMHDAHFPRLRRAA